MSGSPTVSHPLHILPLLGLLALFAGGCASSPDGEGGPIAEPIVTEATPTGDELRQGVPPEFVPALEMIVRAIDDREEEVARAALRRLLARNPTGRTLEIAGGLERILDGRELAARLELSLVAEEQEEINGRYTLFLSARQSGETEVLLRPGGAWLRESLVMVNPDGREQRAVRRQGLPFPEELRFPVDEELRLPLAEVQLPAPAGLLALSSRLSLEIIPGEFVDDEGRYLPAQNLPVKVVELVRLASFLPTGSVAPEELERYVAAGRIFVPALMERAVRILPEDRDETLERLAPLVESISLVELELLVPALRWVSRTARPAGNPEAWRVWMRERAGSVEHRGPDWERIELPGS